MFSSPPPPQHNKMDVACVHLKTQEPQGKMVKHKHAYRDKKIWSNVHTMHTMKTKMKNAYDEKRNAQLKQHMIKHACDEHNIKTVKHAYDEKMIKIKHAYNEKQIKHACDEKRMVKHAMHKMNK